MKQKCLMCESVTLFARGLCAKHYQRAKRDGVLEHVALPAKAAGVHILSNIDRANLTGECASCGPVKLYYRKSRNKYICQDHRKALAKSPRTGQGSSYFKGVAGYTLTSKKKLLEAQDGQCALCRRELSLEKSDLDHCHRELKLRAVLCRPCNLGLGMFQDNPELLEEAAKYIRKFRSSS